MIKKSFILLVILLSVSSADTLKNIEKLYTNGKYFEVCTQSGRIYSEYKGNEKFLNIYADSCLKSDMINRMVLPIVKLYRTKQARENAAYFTTILYQKKMLYYSLCDNIDISYINLPKIDYILSKIFDKYIKKKYIFKNNAYWFSDNTDNEIKYKLSIETKNGIKKMYLRTYQNNNIIKTRVYW